MANFFKNFTYNTKKFAVDGVLKTIEIRYYPEIWYLIGSYFSTVKTKNVLDVGCGNGFFSEALAKTDWTVTCVDPDLNSLMSIQSRFEENEIQGRFEQCSPDSIPVPSSSFEACTLINILEFSQNPSRVIQEVYRVLKPGGKAVIATFNNASFWGKQFVAKSMRSHDENAIAQCLSKREFAMLLKGSRLEIESVKRRAKYFPLAHGKKLNFPVTGSYVAMLTKPKDSAFNGMESESTRISKV